MPGRQSSYLQWVMHISSPMLLTLIRLVGSTLVVPYLIIGLIPCNQWHLNGLVAVFFALISLTDFFDGYLARRYQLESMEGRILDPLADKCLLIGSLIALLVVHKIHFLFVLVLIIREFFVMSLRLFALEYGFSLPVRYGGKVKMMLQMAYITVALFNGYTPIFKVLGALETLLLTLALATSLASAYAYYREFKRRFSLLP
jgi:CDP-diacylglycerol--glycerol-3-phosphate 3-phosphatidyltransferase